MNQLKKREHDAYHHNFRLAQLARRLAAKATNEQSKRDCINKAHDCLARAELIRLCLLDD